MPMSLQKVEVGRPGAVASSFHQDSEEEEWWEDTFSEDNDEITLDALFRETRQAAGLSLGSTTTIMARVHYTEAAPLILTLH